MPKSSDILQEARSRGSRATRKAGRALNWTTGVVVAMGALVFGAALAAGAVAATPSRARPRPVALERPSSRSTFGLEAGKLAGPEFYLYGDPSTLEGQFEDTSGNPDGQGWVGVDRTSGTPLPAGDFAKIFANLTDLDPCLENVSPQMTFLDDGTPPAGYSAGTGGSTSPNWHYGTPGGWVVNSTGGVSGGTQSLYDEVWSPEISWDLPGTGDDGAVGGAILRYDLWEHLPLANGIFHVWAVRSYPDPVGGGWTEWRDRGLFYYSEIPAYVRRELQVGDLLVQDPKKVQIALGVIDAADEFGLPGLDATPSPWLDNVSLTKHAVSGPIITARAIDLFQDSFSHQGMSFDPTNLAGQAVRMDMAQDIHLRGPEILPGDSMVVDVTPTLPGADLARPPTLTWILRSNTLFDPVRTLPSGTTMIYPDVYQGTVIGQVVHDRQGGVVADKWFFDLPDGPPRNLAVLPEPTEPALFFPGDALWYFIEAQDTFGGTSMYLEAPGEDDVLPSEDCGGGTGGGTSGNKKPSTQPVPSDPDPNGLPAIWDENPGKQQPYHYAHILVWNDSGRQEEEEMLELALAQIGVRPGRDYDVYATQAAGSGVSNGLGAAAGGHGATLAQLTEYDCILYLGGDASMPLMSDGTGTGGNDKGDDVALLAAWHAEAKDRAMICFADNIGSAMRNQGSLTLGFVQNVLGVNPLTSDVRAAIGGQSSPRIAPSSSNPGVFSSSFAAYGGCGGLRRFDELEPYGPSGSIAGHGFLSEEGVPIVGPAASVWFDRLEDIRGTQYRRLDVTFPFAFSAIQTVTESAAPSSGESARALLLQEIFQSIGHPTPGGDATDTRETPPATLVVSEAFPNPFNPTATLLVRSPDVRRVVVRVFDLKGRLVRQVMDEVVEAGTHVVRWDGRDAGGHHVASAPYLFEVTAAGEREVRKALLVK